MKLSALVLTVGLVVVPVVGSFGQAVPQQQPATTHPSKARLRADAPDPIKLVWRDREKQRAEQLKGWQAELKAARSEVAKAKDKAAAKENVKSIEDAIRDVRLDPFPLPELDAAKLGSGDVGWLSAVKVNRVLEGGEVVLTATTYEYQNRLRVRPGVVMSLERAFITNMQIKAAGVKKVEKQVEVLVTGLDAKALKPGEDLGGVAVWVTGKREISGGQTVTAVRAVNPSDYVEW